MLFYELNRLVKMLKMANVFLYIVINILIASIFSEPSFCQKIDNNFIKVTSADLMSNDSYNYLCSVFDTKIKDSVQIVALGEVSHGGYEPIAFKAQMARYLIERKGYRKLLIEQSDIMYFRPLRSFLNNPSNNDPLFISKWVKHAGFHEATSQVFLELFKWLKEYNNKHPKDLVEVIGFELGSEQKAINFILNKYIIPNDYKEGQKYVYRLNSADTDADKIELLNSWFKLHQHSLKVKLNKEDLQWLSFYIHNAVNGINNVKSVVENTGNKVSVFRDSVLFENVRSLSLNDKTIVWAHNGHVIRGEIKFMGNRLNDNFKNRYYVIATDFSISAKVQVIKRDSIGDGTYITKIFKPALSSAAYRISESQGITGGIFFSEDLMKMKITKDTNLIDAYGILEYFPAYRNSLDALVVFPNIHPKLPAEKLN